MRFSPNQLKQAELVANRRKEYVNNAALYELNDLHYQKSLEKYSSIPHYAIPKKSFKDDSANALTECVITWLNLNAHYTTRISTQGQYDSRLGIWRPGSTRKGAADVHTCISGKHVSVEVKFGSDRQSQAQKDTQADIVASGGIYIIVSSFSEFLNFYKSITEIK